MGDASEFMAQRDDALAAGDQSGYDYWRGYIDAICDVEGLDLAEEEAQYQREQAWAEETLDAATVYGMRARLAWITAQPLWMEKFGEEAQELASRLEDAAAHAEP